MFRFDTHVHTLEVSFCGHVPAAEMVELYVKAGYSGFIVTDHYNCYSMANHGCQTKEEYAEKFLTGYRNAKAYGDTVGFDVLLGLELALTGSCNEYLLYGVSEEFLRTHAGIFEADMTELRRIADEHDLLIVQAHPYRPGMTRGVPGFLDGVEVFNGNPRHNSKNELSLQYAEQHGLLMTSGSDAHQPEDVGRGGLQTDCRITDLETLKRVLRSKSASLIRNV